MFMIGGSGCNAPSLPDTRASDEKTIRGLDTVWLTGVKDLNATVAFYADNAVPLPPHEAVATDRAAIRASWVGTFSAFDNIAWR
jgi:ketosteroid isomerase-like protein